MKNNRRNDYLLQETAKRLKELQKLKGVSQDIVFIETDINIKRIELAQVNITLSTLSILCNYYDISLYDFFKNIDTREGYLQ